MSEAQNAPPPPPAPVVEEKPKLAEPELPSEQKKLPEEGGATSDAKPQEKELEAEVAAPKTQTDVGATKADSGSGNDSKS